MDKFMSQKEAKRTQVLGLREKDKNSQQEATKYCPVKCAACQTLPDWRHGGGGLQEAM
jgi:hypothetical protein